MNIKEQLFPHRMSILSFHSFQVNKRSVYLPILFAIFFCWTDFSHAQMWNQAGATYTYRYSIPGFEHNFGFVQYSRGTTENINGKTFYHYSSLQVDYNPGIYGIYNDTSRLDTITGVSDFSFYEDDSVVYAIHLNEVDTLMDTLFNFKAHPGEKWTLSQFPTEGGQLLCDSIATVLVLDTGHALLNGQSLYFLSVEFQGFPDKDEIGMPFYRDTIYERIGSLNIAIDEFYLTCYTQLLGNFLRRFNCYADNSFSLGDNCTDIGVHVGWKDLETIHVQAYPNPSQGTMTVDWSGDQEMEISLQNIQGQEVMKDIFKGNVYQLNTLEFEHGFYILHLKNKSGKQTHISLVFSGQ